MRFGTGSYNVRHSEGLNPETLKKSSENKNKFKCTVYFLDCTERVFEIDKSSIGLELLEKVFDHLELIEKDFFSLQFLSFLDSEAEHPRMKWLDPKKSIKKQMVCHPFDLYFKVKFYADPIKLCEEYTRYHFFLQVKKDITEGRLFCPDSSAALLASYSVQSELGDYNSEEQDETYSEHIKILPNQSDTLIENVKSLHQLHHGQSPAQAEANFLDQ
uniref:FERM domain-containing protein n=1 Tax=Rhabditophanes sp. KR3021 TaxID=114890 RepID=A0AC35TTB8_9BILA